MPERNRSLDRKTKLLALAGVTLGMATCCGATAFALDEVTSAPCNKSIFPNANPHMVTEMIDIYLSPTTDPEEVWKIESTTVEKLASVRRFCKSSTLYDGSQYHYWTEFSFGSLRYQHSDRLLFEVSYDAKYREIELEAELSSFYGAKIILRTPAGLFSIPREEY